MLVRGIIPVTVLISTSQGHVLQPEFTYRSNSQADCFFLGTIAR